MLVIIRAMYFHCDFTMEFFYSYGIFFIAQIFLQLVNLKSFSLEVIFLLYLCSIFYILHFFSSFSFIFFFFLFVSLPIFDWRQPEVIVYYIYKRIMLFHFSRNLSIPKSRWRGAVRNCQILKGSSPSGRQYTRFSSVWLALSRFLFIAHPHVAHLPSSLYFLSRSGLTRSMIPLLDFMNSSTLVTSRRIKRY